MPESSGTGRKSRRLWGGLLSGGLCRTGLLLLVWLMPLTVLSDQLQIRVTGDFPELADNIRAFVGEVEGRSAANLRRYAVTVVKRAGRALRALGYYQPQVHWHVQEKGEAGSPQLVLEIQPGPPVRIAERVVRFEGPGAQDPQLTGNLPAAPAVGDILNHGDYDRLRDTLQNRARKLGYFDARFVARALAVDPEQHTARITLVLATGERYRLGQVIFTGEHEFADSLLQQFVPFTPGTPYHADEIAKLNRQLMSSGYFSRVDIDAPPSAAEGGVIPVRVSLHLRPRRSLAAGVGFSTDVGPRLRGTWHEYWTNGLGHKRGAETEISPLRQGISGWYELPLDPPVTDSIRLTAGYQREDIEDVESRRLTLGQQWQHRLDNDWLQLVSLRWESERFYIGNDGESGHSSLLLPGLGYSRLYQDSSTDPSRGYRLQLDMTGSHRAFLSDVDILHVNALAKGLITFAGRHRLLARVQFGALASNDFDDVPPSLRFYAGGDQSVRGYGYETLSPDNDDGDAAGGRYLLAGSGEYQYRFRERWRLALFVDHGNAVNDLSDLLVTGVGMGLRWLSPAGPLRLDLAKGLDRESGGHWRIHFSMGPEL